MCPSSWKPAEFEAVLPGAVRTGQGDHRPAQVVAAPVPQAQGVEHIYLTDNYPDEQNYVLSNGYVAEGIEGHLHIQQVPGSIPLYRLAKFNANTGDLVHIYTSSRDEMNTLLSQGWTYDHVAGYIQRTSTLSGVPGSGPDGFPIIPGGHYMARRCGTNTQCQSEPGFRNYYVGYRSVLSTPKPTGTTRQTMSFDLWSPDYFKSTQHEHIAIGLHGQPLGSLLGPPPSTALLGTSAPALSLHMASIPPIRLQSSMPLS